jgi:DNA-binding NarL/FixJ family response regulator
VGKDPPLGLSPVPSTVPPRRPTTGQEAPYSIAVAAQPLRLIVVDDHQMVLDGLIAMLGRHADRAVVVGATTDPDRAAQLARDQDPDVALVDLRMRTTTGIELCEVLHRVDPELKVVILTVYDDEQYLFRALQAGAAGYLGKQVTAEQLCEALERVAAGETVVDPGLAGRVARSAAQLERGEFWPGAHLGLTQRESEVLALMVRGHSNRAIAQRLTLGEETVKTHVRSILRKLGVADRTQAVAFAIREGLYL